MIFPRPFTFQSKASWNSSEALCVVGLCRDCLQQIMSARSVIWLLLRLSDRSARPCAGHTPGSGCVVLLAVQLFAMEIQPATQVPFTFRKVTSFLWGCFKMKRVQNLVENKKKCRRLFWREFLFTLVFFVFLLVYVQSFPSLWSGCGFRVKWNVLLRQKKSTCSLSKLKSAQSRPNVKKKKQAIPDAPTGPRTSEAFFDSSLVGGVCISYRVTCWGRGAASQGHPVFCPVDLTWTPLLLEFTMGCNSASSSDCGLMFPDRWHVGAQFKTSYSSDTASWSSLDELLVGVVL